MRLYIQGSVGRNGGNIDSDVRIIQTLINFKAERDSRISRLKVDGKCGPNTRRSIQQVQRYIVKMPLPDSRTDPGGITEKALAASLTPSQIQQVRMIQNRPTARGPSTISTVTQPDQVSCGYYAGYAVSVVNRAGRFTPHLSMTRDDVEAARSKFPNPNTYLLPMIAPHYLNTILNVRVRYGNADSRMVGQQDVSNCLSAGRAMMLGSQSHWIALVAMDDRYTITVYNPGGTQGRVIDIMPLNRIVDWPYLVHPVDW